MFTSKCKRHVSVSTKSDAQLIGIDVLRERDCEMRIHPRNHRQKAVARRFRWNSGPLILVLGVALLLLVISASIGFGWPLAVSAVHDDGLFELEGNIVDEPAPGPDWGSIFDSSGNVADLSNGLAAGFAMDDIAPTGLNDDTVFTAGGTKNGQQPSVSWQWGTQSVPEKDDLSNVYAYGTLNPDGHLVLYAGLERLAPNGASHIDIEFNRELIALDEEPPCDNEPCRFLGNKTVGDILVAMEFTNGGALGELRVYQWNGSNYIQVPGGFLAGEGCNAANGIPADTICGFNNDGPADEAGPG